MGGERVRENKRSTRERETHIGRLLVSATRCTTKEISMETG
jgi:hypothetical protein